MNRYTITLNDGKRLEGLTMNGTMYVSQVPVTADDLNAAALERVTIVETDGAGETRETVMQKAVCDGILDWPEGWLFNLREPSPLDRQLADLQAQNDMLTECILEMSEIIYGE